MANMVLADATLPYSFMESFLYDRIIAPGVTSMMSAMLTEWDETIPETGSVLDVGCGGGQIMSLLASKYSQATFTGVDLSADQVRRAENRMAIFGSRASVKEGSALALPFPDKQFDVVYSIASIKHWSDKRQGLLECVRVLKPNGKLMIVEVDRACTLPDTEAFISGWKIPAPLKMGAIAMFRTWVAGHSLDVLETQALANELPLKSVEVTRVAGTPALLLKGVKR